MNSELMFFIQLMTSGVALGCLYALIAVGFVLILKATDILNFAQGEVIMLSAFICYFLVTTFHLPFLVAILLTAIIAGLMGAVTERLVLRPMLGEPVFAVVMVTIGLSIFLKSMAGIIFGHNNLVFPSPFPTEAVKIGGIVLSQAEIWIMLSTLVLITVFFVFFKYSRMGLAMRGTADDQNVALLMGISVKRVYALIWAVSFITAAVVGVFLANIMVINLGLSSVAISAFPAIILGGLESIPGAIVGGLAIGIIENLAGGYLDQIVGGGIKDVTPFVVLFLVLMIKPYGLFGKREIERV